MPYIPREQRPRIDMLIRALKPDEMTVGEINYAITRMILTRLGGVPRYADYNEAIGVLECIKLELYSQQVRRYEDSAKVRNGPV